VVSVWRKLQLAASASADVQSSHNSDCGGRTPRLFLATGYWLLATGYWLLAIAVFFNVNPNDSLARFFTWLNVPNKGLRESEIAWHSA
jgi:hypothetical protein